MDGRLRFRMNNTTEKKEQNNIVREIIKPIKTKLKQKFTK